MARPKITAADVRKVRLAMEAREGKPAPFTFKVGPRIASHNVTVLPVANGDGTHRIERRRDGVLTFVLPRVRIGAHDAALVEAGATEGFHGGFDIIEDGP